MRKLFGIINRGKSILFVSVFALAAIKGRFVPFLPADTVSIDFKGNEILASDLAPHTEQLNMAYAPGFSPEFAEKARECFKKTKVPDFRKMSLKELTDRVLEVHKKTLETGGNIEIFDGMTVESVLQVDWQMETVYDFIKEKCEADIKSSKERGCVHDVKEDDNEGRLITFHLKNGKISGAESQKLFARLGLPLRLVFENVQGTLAKNDTLKQLTVSMEFKNCRNLTFGTDCFRDAEKLERVNFYSSNVRLSNGAFANCKNFECVYTDDSKLLCLPPNTVFQVFGSTLKHESIREFIVLNLLCLCREPLSDKQRVLDFLQCNGIDIAFSDAEKKASMIEKERQRIHKEVYEKVKSREQQCNSIEKENVHLRSANQNLQDQMQITVQKNKDLRAELKETRQTCEGLSKEYSQLKSEYENFKKIHAEAVEKITKELGKSRNDCSIADGKLEKYRSSLNAAKEELRTLRETNKEQNEEIETLKAFKSQWEAKIPTFERLEAEKNELSKQLKAAEYNESEAMRKLGQERAKNKEELKKKQADIGNLKKELNSLALELTETRKLLSEAQFEIKELKNSETHILTTVGGALADDEDEKEEEKNNAFRPVKPVVKKNFKNYLPTSNRKKDKVWKNFEYPKNNK